MNLKKILQNIGLSEKEARVYLACVEVGSGPVSAIAGKAAVNRVTAYSILEKLIERGMVTSLIKHGVRTFNPTQPKVVAQELKRKTSDFQKALPFFSRLGGEANFPHVRYFEGMEAIKTLYAESLLSRSEILNYSNSKEIRDHWPEYDEEYVDRRIRKNIFLRGISPLDEYGLKVRSEDRQKYREIRLVPAKKFTFTNEINIWDDKMAIISFKDTPPIGVMIESQEIANTQRDIFTMAWAYAAKQ